MLVLLIDRPNNEKVACVFLFLCWRFFTAMQVPPKSKPAWDSNIITPGTLFMHELSVYLRFYIQDRVNRDKAWQNIKVCPVFIMTMNFSSSNC